MADAVGQWLMPKRLKFLALAAKLFRCRSGDETILSQTKPFSAFGAEFRKPVVVIKRPTNTGGQRPAGKSGEKSNADHQLRPRSRLCGRRLLDGRVD
jgi:hypothetical protein